MLAVLRIGVVAAVIVWAAAVVLERRTARQLDIVGQE
jgi:hypothetical protein